MDLISLLVLIVVVIGLVWLGVWVADQTLPAPAQMIAKAIIGLIALVLVIHMLLSVTGVSVPTLHIGR